jgi:hypothetical protein
MHVADPHARIDRLAGSAVAHAVAPGFRGKLRRLTCRKPAMMGNGRRGMLARDEDILKAAEDWRKAGRGVALATVVETWGSAPRPVGSNLVIDDQGNFLGSVSGGCVEGAVVTEAIEVIGSGLPRVLEFGVADETAWKVGLSCGGTIRVLVEKVE